MKPIPGSDLSYSLGFRSAPARVWVRVASATAALVLLSASAAHGATLLWKGPNAAVYFGLPFNSLEFENPLAGTETVLSHKVLEWRDADYAAGPPPWYDDWTVSHPGLIDGNANEIYLRTTNHAAWTTTTVPSRIVSIHLNSDDNDGLADVAVDGVTVAQLDMFTVQCCQTVLIIVTGLSNTTHTITVTDRGAGQGRGDDVHIMGAAALAESDLKWGQPPLPAEPWNVFYGWNQQSMENIPPIAADDWVCTNSLPITKIRWWGSFIGWNHPDPPYNINAFRIRFWTDVPAGADPQFPFSHPGGQVGPEIFCQNFTVQWVGWDYDPRSGRYEACFMYEQVLLPHEWFYQNPGNGTNIYWISIEAVAPDPPLLWGWKTRPREPNSPAPDDAVMFDPRVPWYQPLWWPDPTNSWDLAFELICEATVPTAKWTQWPDLTENGIDINCTSNAPAPNPFLLADDFLCTSTGPITNITIWASWKDDAMPGNNPSNVIFTLSIHTDTTNTSPPFNSMPGTCLWTSTFTPGRFICTQVTTNKYEYWWNPSEPNALFPGDQTCYRYDFHIPPAQAFNQQGTPDQPVVYWLDVQARPGGGTAPHKLGWKTSTNHWHDDAVWVMASEPYSGVWNELRYPPNHQYAGQSIDLAFRINVGEEQVSITKWSQPPMPYIPPDVYNGWNQLSVEDQQIVADDWACTNATPVTDIHWWGSFVGWGFPGIPEQPAPTLPIAFQITIWTDVPQGITNPYSHPGTVLKRIYCTNFTWEFVGWDFDPRNPGAAPEACFKWHQDLLPEEYFYQDPGSGTNIYWVSIAAVYPVGQQIDYPWGWKTRPHDPNSLAPDAAVVSDAAAPVGWSPLQYPPGTPWDMAFELTTKQEVTATNDFGDAPGPYPTMLANDGARHTMVRNVTLGNLIDAELDGQPNPTATGDDINNLADEDGVMLLTPLVPGQQAAVRVVASLANGILNAWIDFGADGSWAQPTDQIANNVVLPLAGPNIVIFNVPQTAAAGSNVFARFRFSTTPGLTFTGLAPNGEVEDYLWHIDQLDLGDAPDPTYPTYLRNNGASHVIGPLYLGAGVDAETDGQPNPAATGDDMAGTDDEDGVFFPTALIANTPATIQVVSSGTGLLQGWFDFNCDGDWADVAEQQIFNKPVAAGTNLIQIFVPNAVPGQSYARFRLSTQTNLTFTGQAPDGEVEDYAVTFQNLKWSMPPEQGSEGVDVNDLILLADDFMCYQSGPITDIHIWGSFHKDKLPAGGPGNMIVTLRIYSDVPAGPGGYSQPGTLLWSRTFGPGQFNAGLAMMNTSEWWHNPAATPPLWLANADTNIWQLDFYIDATNAFVQVSNTVYWLGVQYTPVSGDTNYNFGWKTSYRTFNDAACWYNASVGIWRQLVYGDGHPKAGYPPPSNWMHMAFALSTSELDWGDAPDSAAAPGYPTLATHNGAAHVIVPGLALGSLTDSEADGQPDATATGDDNANLDDEDGVSLPVLVPGQPATVSVTVSGSGLLSAWIDFGADGSWAEAGDQILADVPLATGTHLLNFNVPSNAVWGATTFARFRFSTASGLGYTGVAPDGEVEDHPVNIHPLPPHDLGDAPDSSNNGAVAMTAYPKGGPPGVLANYPTVYGGAGGLPPFGPIHLNPQAVAFLGMGVSGELEADILPDQDFVNNIVPATDTPDQDGADDGLIGTPILPHCGLGTINVLFSWAPGPGMPMWLNVWCDWNRDGDWNDVMFRPDGTPVPEWAGQNIPVPAGVPALPVSFLCWHPSLKKDPIWIRITLSEQMSPPPLGSFSGLAGGDGPQLGYQFGETEDYYITDYDDQQTFDFGDAPAPYLTTLPNGARHLIVPNFMLGRQIDSEPNGQPDPLALGDDNSNLPDEDGVTFNDTGACGHTGMRERVPDRANWRHARCLD